MVIFKPAILGISKGTGWYAWKIQVYLGNLYISTCLSTAYKS